MALFEVKNLTFTYPNGEKPALNGVNLTVNEGDFCLVLGASGSGKSTLLRLLKKEIAPFGTADGEINVNAENVAFVNQNVESNIVTDTVVGELAFALENAQREKNEIALKIAEVASYFNLNSVFNERVENLSGGTKQMLSLASALTVNPGALILDEPTSQLDPASAENFENMVIKLNRDEGMTVLVSEHRAQNLLGLASKILYLENGRSMLFGSAKEYADYLIKTNSNFKLSLPAYTLAMKSAPTDFISAKENAHELEIKPITENTEKFEVALNAKRLAFSYGKGQGDVLFNLDYKAYKGKINVIVGANGCGKTTLLKALAGVLKCYSGKIKATGKMCYMPQNVETMFLKDTVSAELEGNGELIEKFNLGHLKGQNPFDLSGGEAQRLALAKALATGADILLLDEPTKSVDAVFKVQFAQMLKDLSNEGKTVIIVTHDLEFAGEWADYVSFLFDKNIIAFAERRKFFSALTTYTTALSRLTNGRAVSLSDVRWRDE